MSISVCKGGPLQAEQGRRAKLGSGGSGGEQVQKSKQHAIAPKSVAGEDTQAAVGNNCHASSLSGDCLMVQQMCEMTSDFLFQTVLGQRLFQITKLLFFLIKSLKAD